MFVCKLSVIIVLLINLRPTWTQHGPGQLSQEALALQTMLQSAVQQNRHLQAQNARLKVIWSGLENMCTSITSHKCNCEAPTGNHMVEQKHPSKSQNLAAEKIRDMPPPSVEFYRHDNGRIINSAKFKNKLKQTKSSSSSGHPKYTVAPSPIADVLKDLNIAPYTDKPAVYKTTTTPPYTGHPHANNGMDFMHEMLGSHTHKDTNRGQPQGNRDNSIRNLSLKPLLGPAYKGQGPVHGHAPASRGRHNHAAYTTHTDSITAVAGHKHHLAEFDFINEVGGKTSSRGHQNTNHVQDKHMAYKPPVDNKATNVRAVDPINNLVDNTAINVRELDLINTPLDNKATNVRLFDPINTAVDNKATNVPAVDPINTPVDNKAANVRTFHHTNTPVDNKATNVPAVDPINTPVDNKATNVRFFDPINTPVDNKATNVHTFHRINTPVDNKATNVPAVDPINTPVDNKATNVRTFHHINTQVDNKATNVRAFDLMNRVNGHLLTNDNSPLSNSHAKHNDKTHGSIPIHSHNHGNEKPITPNNKLGTKLILNDLLLATEQSIQEKQKTGQQNYPKHMPTNTANNHRNAIVTDQSKPIIPVNPSVIKTGQQNYPKHMPTNTANNHRNAIVPDQSKPIIPVNPSVIKTGQQNYPKHMPTNTAKNLRNAIVQDQSKPIIPVNPRVIKTGQQNYPKHMPTNTAKNLRNAIVQDQSKPIIPVNPRVIKTGQQNYPKHMPTNTAKNLRNAIVQDQSEPIIPVNPSVIKTGQQNYPKHMPTNTAKNLRNAIVQDQSKPIIPVNPSVIKTGQQNYTKHMPTNTAKNLRNAIVQDQSKPIIPVNPSVIKTGQQNYPKHMPTNTANNHRNAIVTDQSKPIIPVNPSVIVPQIKPKPIKKHTRMTTKTTTAAPKVMTYVKLAIKAVTSEGLVTNTITVTVRYSAPADHTTEWLQLQSNGATTRTSGVKVHKVGGPHTEYSSNMVFVDAIATRHALFRLFGNNKSISIQFNLTELHLSGEQLLPDFEDDIINFDDTLQAQRDRDLVIDLEVRGSPSENPALRHTEIFFTGLNTTTRPQTVFEIVHFNSDGVSVVLQPRTRFTSTMKITLKRPYIDFGGILTVRLPQTVGGYLAGYYYGHLIRVLEFYTHEVIPFGNLGVYYLPKKTLVREPSQSILCAAMGNPPPDVVILKLSPDGTEKKTLTETIMLDTVTNMKSLTLYADKPNASEGKYICRASIGSEVVDSTTEVVIVQPPEFDEVHTGVTSKTSTTVTISCKAAGKPRPKLEIRLYEENGPSLAKTGIYETSLLTPNNFTSHLTLTVPSNREFHTVVCVAKQDISGSKEHYKHIIVFPNSDDYTNWYLYNRHQSMATG